MTFRKLKTFLYIDPRSQCLPGASLRESFEGGEGAGVPAGKEWGHHQTPPEQSPRHEVWGPHEGGGGEGTLRW